MRCDAMRCDAMRCDAATSESEQFDSLLSAIASWIHSYFDNVMTKFMVNNRTDAWKTDVNLLIRPP